MHIQQWFSVKCFTPDECDSIIGLGIHSNPQRASVLGKSGRRQSICRTAKAGWVSPAYDTEWIYKRLWETVTHLNDRTFKFEIDTLEPIQYIDYTTLGWYDKHVDNGDDRVATRKLSISINLSGSNEYVGGRLYIESNAADRHAPAERGQAVVFPSHLPHRANPVWLGSRKVLVAWIRGKNALK